jgi:FKBP-type peptidyl-prolyl cis-trans isomerase SlyD
MQIQKNSVVSIEYTLKDDEANLIDSSEGNEPLVYLHGHENIVPGLEKELDGKTPGDELEVVIAAADGYGDRVEEMVQEVPKTEFESPDEIEVGTHLQVESEEEGVMMFEVVGVDDDHFVVDGNHPLAGMNLHFAVKVLEIREATEEEVTHGHVHGPDGHEH